MSETPLGAGRPYVVASAAMSVDGRIDSAGPERLVLSSDEDWEAIDALRAECDAILVGGGTVRADDPSLRVKEPGLIASRVAAGRTPQPRRVVLSATADFPTARRLFQTSSPKTLLCTSESAAVPEAITRTCDVWRFPGESLGVGLVLDRLHADGVRRLLLEGGSRVLTDFLVGDFVDELRLAVAPFFVGESGAPPLVHPAAFPHHPGRPMRLLSLGQLGGVVVCSYELGATDTYWLRHAIELSRRCPKVEGSFAVGAVIVSAEGEKLGEGHSLETGLKAHAEEAALAKAESAGVSVAGATMYSSLEPCSVRLSGRPPCCQHLIDAGIARVVFALKEPPTFVTCEGAATLTQADIAVTHRPDLGHLVAEVNRHLPGVGEE